MADPKIKYLSEVAQVSEQMADQVELALEQGDIPLILGGDQSISIGSIAGIASFYKKRNEKIGVIWFDAHGDSNLPSSNAVPYLGGMVITAAAGHWDSGLGAGLSMSNVVLVGARDLDPHERQLIDSGVLKVLPPGPRLAERLGAAVGDRDVYVHLDCDVLEPGLVPLEYQVPGGLSFEDLRACCTELTKRKVIGLEVSEFESEWLDGRPGSADKLVDAIAPLIG